MKSLYLVTLLVGLASASAFAGDLSLSGDANLGSRFIYRGTALSNDATVGLDGKVDNVLVDGLYGSVQANTLTTTPLNDTTVRTDLGVGFHTGFGVESFDVDGSFHRVFNPTDLSNTGFQALTPANKLAVARSVLSTKNVAPDALASVPTVLLNDYNEVRLNASYNVLGAKVFGEVDHVVSSDFSKDTYYAVGLEGPVLSDKLTLGALVSGVTYDVANVSRYNNTLFYGKYNVWKGLDAEASYSLGGKYADNTNVDNHAYVGLRYRF